MGVYAVPCFFINAIAASSTGPCSMVSAPAAITMVVQLAHQIVTLYLVSRIGTDAVAAVSSAGNALFVVIAMCILSASSAFYLILELGMPFGGLMQLSSEPLHNALK